MTKVFCDGCGRELQDRDITLLINRVDGLCLLGVEDPASGLHLRSGRGRPWWYGNASSATETTRETA